MKIKDLTKEEIESKIESEIKYLELWLKDPKTTEEEAKIFELRIMFYKELKVEYNEDNEEWMILYKGVWIETLKLKTWLPLVSSEIGGAVRLLELGYKTAKGEI